MIDLYFKNINHSSVLIGRKHNRIQYQSFALMLFNSYLQGQFIGEYIGEVIDDSEARRRDSVCSSFGTLFFFICDRSYVLGATSGIHVIYHDNCIQHPHRRRIHGQRYALPEPFLRSECWSAGMSFPCMYELLIVSINECHIWCSLSL